MRAPRWALLLLLACAGCAGAPEGPKAPPGPCRCGERGWEAPPPSPGPLEPAPTR